MALNVVGLFRTLRQPAAWPPAPPAEHLVWRDGSLFRQEGEAEPAYLERLTMSIHYRMVHVPDATYRPPLDENWVLGTLALVLPSFQTYEYNDYRRALARGAGVCTQFVNAQFDLLRRNGIRASAVLFRDHTVIEAQTRTGQRYTLDPDYGVVLPHPIEALRAEPTLARSVYARLDPADGPHPNLSRTQISEIAVAAFASPVIAVNSKDVTPYRAQFERLAYRVKWLFPGLLLAGAAIVIPRQRKEPAPSQAR